MLTPYRLAGAVVSLLALASGVGQGADAPMPDLLSPQAQDVPNGPFAGGAALVNHVVSKAAGTPVAPVCAPVNSVCAGAVSAGAGLLYRSAFGTSRPSWVVIAAGMEYTCDGNFFLGDVKVAGTTYYLARGVRCGGYWGALSGAAASTGQRVDFVATMSAANYVAADVRMVATVSAAPIVV